MILVPVITRAVSVAADAAVLGITLWKSFYILKVEQSRSSLTATLAYNGKIAQIGRAHV